MIANRFINIDDIHAFKINSCHAKGSIGIEVDDYAFIGDATAPCFKKGQYVYNTQMLKDEIDKLSSLKAKYVVMSHHMEEVKQKEEVINRLKNIYLRRDKNSPYILDI